MSTPERDLIVGGQAVIEGVMMRTPNAYAIAEAAGAARRRGPRSVDGSGNQGT